jgi:hypothetical protein
MLVGKFLDSGHLEDRRCGDGKIMLERITCTRVVRKGALGDDVKEHEISKECIKHMKD